MLLHHALKELLHGLACDRNRTDQVSGGAGGFVLSDAPVYVQTDATLVAVTEELEAVQVLLLGSQAIQLDLQSIRSCSLPGCFNCLLSQGVGSELLLFCDDVFLKDLLEHQHELASLLALACLSGYHEFLELIERYLIDVSWTPTQRC